MDDDGRPCHQASPQRELCLVGRLNVIDVGRRPAGAAPWQIDEPRQLTGNERGAEMLRSPEGRGTGFHIHIRGEGAIADRRARVHQLCQGDRRQRLGMAERHRRLDGDRRHRPHQGEWRDDRHLAVAGEIDQPLCHRNVDLARRVGVDDGVAMALCRKFVIAQATEVTQDLEALDHLRRAAAEDEGQLVGHCELRIHGEVMPHIHRHILRLDQRRHHLQHIEMLGQLDQLLKIPPGAGTAPAFQVGGVRRAGPGLEDERAGLQQHVAVAACGAAQD